MHKLVFFVRSFAIDFLKTVNHKTGIHGWELSEWQWPRIKIRTECSCAATTCRKHNISLVRFQHEATLFTSDTPLFWIMENMQIRLWESGKDCILLLRTITKIYYYMRKTIKFFIVKNLKVLSIWNSLKLKYR